MLKDAEISYSLIPEGELRCIWMDAGIVGFKLCDRKLECEGCPFDAEVRRTRSAALPAETAPEPELSHQPASAEGSTYADVIASRLRELAASHAPDDRMYHRSHFWAQRLDRDVYRIGIDHLAATLLRPVTSIVRSNTPAPVRLHEPFGWIVVSRGTVTLPAPLEGTVIAFNTELLNRPSLIDTDPYGAGWIANISTRPKGRGLQEFVSASDRRGLVVKQSTAMLHAFLKTAGQGRSGIGPTMYDGGTGIVDIESLIGPKPYFDVLSRIFRLPLD